MEIYQGTLLGEAYEEGYKLGYEAECKRDTNRLRYVRQKTEEDYSNAVKAYLAGEYDDKKALEEEILKKRGIS